MPVDAASQVQPTIFVQDFRTGDSCTGVAYTGTAAVLRRDASFPALDGRVHRRSPGESDPAIDGGLLSLSSLASAAYLRVAQVWCVLPGCSAITVSAVSPDGVWFQVARSESDTMVLRPVDSVLLLPGWDLVIWVDSPVTGAGSVVVVTEAWAQPCTFVK